MVELKQLTIGDLNALGISINLPRGIVHFIVRNHLIVCDECIDVERMLKRYPNLCMVQVKSSLNLEDMLKEKIHKCSDEAIKEGISLGMNVIDVITLL